MALMDPGPPTQGRTAAIITTLAEAAISAVPIVGAPVATLLTAGAGGVVNRRLTDWFAELARTVEQLGARVDELQPERLANSDVFADAVMTAARTVEKTSQQEKLDALRNAVLNSVMPGAPDADVRASFFAIIDDFTPSHLRMLRLYDDPRRWLDSHRDDMFVAHLASSMWNHLVEAALPELVGEVAARFFADLNRDGLVTIRDFDARIWRQNGTSGRVTSGYGQRFLAFIANPVVPG